MKILLIGGGFENAIAGNAARADASDPESVAALARRHDPTHVLNAVEWAVHAERSAS